MENILKKIFGKDIAQYISAIVYFDEWKGRIKKLNRDYRKHIKPYHYGGRKKPFAYLYWSNFDGEDPVRLEFQDNKAKRIFNYRSPLTVYRHRRLINNENEHNGFIHIANVTKQKSTMIPLPKNY